ncbi:MAG TPA: hypothetical protein VGH74_06925, partial [Planctomycetaceae bacterium]
APRRTLRGQCIDHVDKSPLAGVPVRIFRAQGRTAPIVEHAKTVTDREGRFEFPISFRRELMIRSINSSTWSLPK